MLDNLLKLIEHITCGMGRQFLEFTRVARDKEDLHLGICQWKTEKWLQAELIVRFRGTGCYGAVAEVSKKHLVNVDRAVAEVGRKRLVDVVVWAVEDNKKRVGIMLKCWQNSAQPANDDGPALEKDVDWALEEVDRVAIALLPDEVQRGDYTDTVLNVVQEDPNMEWEVPFSDVNGVARCVRVFCWYKA